MVKEAYKQLKDTQDSANKLRTEHLEDLVKKRAEQWNMKEEHALQTIIKAEASKKTFARHGKWMKPTKKEQYPIYFYRNQE